MKRWFFVFSMLVSSIANAGSSNDLVTSVVVNVFDQALIVAGNINNVAPCATLNKFVIDLGTAHGKAMYALILSAQSQNRPVIIEGRNVCDIRSNAESIQYVNFAN